MGNLGTAVVKEASTGTYYISIANQPSSAPSVVSAKLTTSQPYTSVQLQENPGTLSITAQDSRSFSYDETLSYHTFNVSYVNSSNLQQDVILSYTVTDLPPNWQVAIPNSTLKAGGAGQVVVTSQPFSIAGTVTFNINAVCNSVAVASAPISLTQFWHPQLVRSWAGATNGSNWFGWETVTFNCVSCTGSGYSASILWSDDVQTNVTTDLAEGVPAVIDNGDEIGYCNDPFNIALTMGQYYTVNVSDPQACSRATSHFTTTW